MDLDFDETIFAKDLISDFTISKRDREKIRSTKEKFRTADFLYGNCSFLSMHRQRTARVLGNQDRTEICFSRSAGIFDSAASSAMILTSG